MTDADALYLTDKAIAAKLGIDEKTWRVNAAVLERQGLPPCDPLFLGRRYWPSVRAFLDRRNGLRPATMPAGGPDGVEKWEAADA